MVHLLTEKPYRTSFSERQRDRRLRENLEPLHIVGRSRRTPWQFRLEFGSGASFRKAKTSTDAAGLRTNSIVCHAQIVSSAFRQMLREQNGEESKRVMEAMLKMDKIDGIPGRGKRSPS